LEEYLGPADFLREDKALGGIVSEPEEIVSVGLRLGGPSGMHLKQVNGRVNVTAGKATVVLAEADFRNFTVRDR
jgi:hypothetical protein